jgi:hypothetical protein
MRTYTRSEQLVTPGSSEPMMVRLILLAAIVTLFYQCNGKVLKVRATDGEVLQSVSVSTPSVCISWNTVLVDDGHEYFVATRWYGRPEWDSALRVYDKDLNLVWERTGLPIGKKDTLAYVDGKLVTGSGNHWSKDYEGEA